MGNKHKNPFLSPGNFSQRDGGNGDEEPTFLSATLLFKLWSMGFMEGPAAPRSLLNMLNHRSSSLGPQSLSARIQVNFKHLEDGLRSKASYHFCHLTILPAVTLTLETGKIEALVTVQSCPASHM